MEELLVLVVGLFLRIGIPIGITAFLILGLKRLDQRWQHEAEEERVKAAAPVGNTGCWEVNHCSDEQKADCKAYNEPERPCWQVFRGEDGCLQGKCLVCQVFRRAPLPVAAKT